MAVARPSGEEVLLPSHKEDQLKRYKANLACASSKLWSVIVMICCRTSLMSCFLESGTMFG